MPRRRKTFNLAPSHAAHALSILIQDGKVKARDVARALRRREALIQELRARLAALGDGVLAATRGRGRKPGRRVSAAQRAARQAQGRYLAAVRRLSKADRAKVKAIREKSGVRTAIAAAKRMAARKNAPTLRSKKRMAFREGTAARGGNAQGGRSAKAPKTTRGLAT